MKESIYKTYDELPLFGDWLDFWYQSYSKPALRHTTQLSYENWIYLHAMILTAPCCGSFNLRELLFR